MNHQLHSVGILADHIRDNFSPTDYSFIKDYENLLDLIVYRVELGEEFEKIAERFLEEMHQIVIDIAIFQHKERISPSQNKKMLSAFIKAIKKSTSHPKITDSLIDHLIIRDTIHTSSEKRQEARRKNQESSSIENIYYSLKNISLETLFLLQSFYPTNTRPELFKEFLKTSYKANTYYTIACLIIQDKIRIELGEEKIQSITALLHQSVELEAAYMYLLQLWKPDDTLSAQKIRNIEIVAATLEHKHQLAKKVNLQKLESFLTQG